MEGKCVLFKAFGDVDAIPLCIRSKEVDDIVNTVALLAGSFGGINLEDISAPRCFEIEEKLKKRCDIPVFHDDQHGTAVIALAGVMNALKVVGKKLEDVKVVMSGAGAAGTAICKILLGAGMKNVIMSDKDGVIYRGREGMGPALQELAELTNPENQKGTLRDILPGADLFIGATAWAKGAGAAGVDRMAVYCNKERYVAVDELVPLTRAMTTPNAERFSYDTAYAANISEVQLFYNQTMVYVDGI